MPEPSIYGADSAEPIPVSIHYTPDPYTLAERNRRADEFMVKLGDLCAEYGARMVDGDEYEHGYFEFGDWRDEVRRRFDGF